MFKTQKINKVKLEPVLDNNNIDPKMIRGYDYYKEPYCNICSIGRKKSGKTVLLYRALENCVGKGTNVMIFSPTCHIDPTFKEMKKMLEKKKCNVLMKEHFIDENGLDLLDVIYKGIIKENENEEDDEGEKIPPKLWFGDNPDFTMKRTRGSDSDMKIKEVKHRKKQNGGGKKITPKYCFVFDDLSSHMRHPSISRLIIKNRHIFSKCWFNCHSVNNLDKMALSSIDVFHVFPNISNEKIEELSEKVNITFKNDTKKNPILQRIYDFATQERYNHLYIDRGDCTFRKNFDEIIEIPE
jgi:hypothetical protein